MPNTNEPKMLTPKELADQLFEAATTQTRGNYREAAGHVIMFLQEALVYAVSASTAGDDSSRKALLKSVGETIAGLAGAQPTTPAPGAP